MHLLRVFLGKIGNNQFSTNFLLNNSLAVGPVMFVYVSAATNLVKHKSDVLVHAMGNIMNRFYNKQTNTIFILHQSSEAAPKTYELKPLDVLGEIIRNEEDLAYVVEEHTALHSIGYSRSFNIFIVDNYNSFRQVYLHSYLARSSKVAFDFRNIFLEMSSMTHDFTGYYTIILTEHSDDCEETVTKIFQDCWSLYIANAIILTPTEDYETIVLYTYFPYTAYHCGVVEAVVYDYFENNAFTLNSRIFPDKFRNFHQCPIRMSTYSLPPFMILQPQPDGTIQADGIEGSMFQAMAERLNFTPIVVQTDYNVLADLNSDSKDDKSKPRPKTSLSVVTFDYHRTKTTILMIKLNPQLM